MSCLNSSPGASGGRTNGTYYEAVASHDVQFSTVLDVSESWDMVKRIPNWDTVVGELFLRRLLEISDEMKTLWGFKSADPNDPKVYQSKPFVSKGVALIMAVDKAVALLGPDVEPLQEILFDLGRQHIHMRAEPEYWPLVGDAIFFSLEKGLGKRFTEKMRDSWTIIYNFLAYWMIEGLQAEKADRRRRGEQKNEPGSKEDESRTSPPAEVVAIVPKYVRYEPVALEDIMFTTVDNVMTSWKLVTRIKDWEEVAGCIFLRRLFHLAPELKALWGFDTNADHDDPAMYTHYKFVNKAVALIKGVDLAVAMLGPDMEPLGDELFALGRRHIRMKAEPEYWPVVEVALFHTLKVGLGEKLTEEMIESWTVIYRFMAYWMIEGLLAEKREKKMT